MFTIKQIKESDAIKKHSWELCSKLIHDDVAFPVRNNKSANLDI